MCHKNEKEYLSLATDNALIGESIVSELHCNKGQGMNGNLWDIKQIEVEVPAVIAAELNGKKDTNMGGTRNHKKRRYIKKSTIRLKKYTKKHIKNGARKTRNKQLIYKENKKKIKEFAVLPRTRRKTRKTTN